MADALTPAEAAARFAIDSVAAVRPLPGGHINASWRVATGAGADFLLQRLNGTVFPAPERVMENVARVTAHQAAAKFAGRGTLEPLRLVATRDGHQWLEEAGSTWRMFAWVAGAHALQRADSADRVREAARAFGEFGRLLADYDGAPLHRTIAGFHDTGRYLQLLKDAERRDRARRAGAVRAELAAVWEEQSRAAGLSAAIAGGAVPVRIAHHDAKLSNVLFDEATGAARCVVDLDTVMPGSLLFDFGDLVRSMTSPTDEDEPDPGTVGVRRELFAAVAGGFLQELRAVLTAAERQLLVAAGLAITYEQAVRFLADYLDGDRYYRVSDAEQNLRRARTQLRLLGTLAAQRAELERLVAGLR